MIAEIKIPSPGESISEVEISNWLVSSGDFVENRQGARRSFEAATDSCVFIKRQLCKDDIFVPGIHGTIVNSRNLKNNTVEILN